MRRSFKSTLAGLALAALATTTAGPALADSGSGRGIGNAYFTSEEAADYSKDIEKMLATDGTRVAIVFRAGRDRDQLPDGIDYTHGAFWVYQPIQREDGSTMKGYVVWNLFHGDGETLPRTQSELVQDFPFDFVTGAKAEDLAVIVPTPAMQKRIMTMMADGRYEAVHDADYSVIASPFDDRYQNCTEFLLDVVAAAAWQTTDYQQLKLNLSAHFEASTIKTGPIARLFGPLIDEQVKLGDHRGKPIRTVSYQSLARFMLDNGYADETFKVTPSSVGGTRIAMR
ncbi:MAG: DUF2145 domain-containing protein [Pseudomonadota bacterium]